MAVAALEADQVTKVFSRRFRSGEFRALDGVSFSVDAGTTFGLLGPNGAGKTTFVKSLLSATHATSGTTRIFGLDSRLKQARQPVGYLPENHRFPIYLTGTGMLDLYGALSGMNSSTRRDRIPELLKLVGLEDWGAIRLGKYSKGMLQRVGLAQALMHRPRLLILDEPTDGVDPVGRVQIRNILRALEADGVTIFINSHLLAEVELLCRDVAILHKGRLRLSGRVAEMTANQGYQLTVPIVAEALQTQLSLAAKSVTIRDGHLEILYADRDLANAAIDLLRTAGHPIEALAATRSTLEQIFMETVQ
jgi:ABC-2 type transport system ATP-binding protein